MTRDFSAKLQRGIGVCLIILVAIMPFHAFLSVWLGSITHHQAIIQAWKEVLLLVLAGAGAVVVIRSNEARDRLRSWPVILAGLFALVALIVTAATRPSLTAMVFGAKTDLEFLVAFVLALLIATPWLVRRLTWAILLPAAVVIGFGILQITVLAPNFLTHFGYGASTIQPYETLNQGVKNLRFGSTLGGPNQLGTYLILPMALAAMIALRRRRWWLLVIPVLGSFVLVHTYSRAAWLGALAATIVLVLVLVPSRLRTFVSAAIAALGIIAVLIVQKLLKNGNDLKYYILHGGASQSDTQHLQSLETGASLSLAHPLGHGLGTAGPAVFHSGQGLIIENNYLQVSYETGLAGALLFGALVVSLSLELARRSPKIDLAAASLAALLGVCVTALFLPAWTDSSTALILWTAAGASVGLTPETRHV